MNEKTELVSCRTNAYDRTQAQLAHNDLCSLGYERLALEG